MLNQLWHYHNHSNCFCGQGLLCHIDDACISNPCKMGAQCDTNPVNGKFNCNCASGYKGSTCAEDIDECVIGKTRIPYNFLSVIYWAVSIEAAQYASDSTNTFLSIQYLLTPIFLLSFAIHQGQTHVSMVDHVRTQRGRSPVIVLQATKDPAVRWTLTNVSPVLAKMTPPAWTR